MSELTIKQKEQEGRDKLKLVFPSIKWSFASYSDHYDAECINRKNEKVIAEIKVRDVNSWEYPTAMLEQQKLNDLRKIPSDKMIYVCHYNDNITCTWNLSNIEFDKLQSNSYLIDKYTLAPSNKVYKKVYYLPINQADIRITSTGKKGKIEREYTERELRIIEFLKRINLY